MVTDPNAAMLTPGSDVAAAFAAYEPKVRAALLVLRELLLETARETAGVGTIEETLKWGQPSYLTSETGSGSTVRIAPTGSGSDHDYGMFFICRTDLVDRFREQFGDALDYEGNRALVFSVGDPLPLDELRVCIAMALTYHRRATD